MIEMTKLPGESQGKGGVEGGEGSMDQAGRRRERERERQPFNNPPLVS